MRISLQRGLIFGIAKLVFRQRKLKITVFQGARPSRFGSPVCSFEIERKMDRITNLLGVQAPSNVHPRLPLVQESSTFPAFYEAGLDEEHAQLRLHKPYADLGMRNRDCRQQVCARLRVERRGDNANPEQHGLGGTSRTATESQSDDILQAIDSERERIGQELHDTLGQQLSGIKFLCTGLVQKIESRQPISPSDVMFIEQQVNVALAQTRSLAKGLTLIDFDQKELAEAFDELKMRLDQLNIGCQIDCDRQLKLSAPVQRELYHIAQEAVSNAIKHGRASRISIALRSDGRTSVFLAIQNDGLPFPSPHLSPGIGLKLMTRRACKIGATLEVGCGESGGACVMCTIPRVR